MPERLPADDAIAALARRLGGRGRVYAPGSAGESPLLTAALARNPGAARGLTFFGVWFPGINRVDYAGLHDEARSESFFVSPDLRESFERGKVAFRPLAYSAIYPWLEQTGVDAALLHVSPPDREGMCSLGVAADFPDTVIHRAGLKIAHVNPAMPATRGAPVIPYDSLDIAIEDSTPLLAYEPPPPPRVIRQAAAHVAALIDDGATVQFGLGKMQFALIPLLTERRHLRMHTGMITAPIAALLSSGALEDAGDAVTTGTAIGDVTLYRLSAHSRRVRFAPASYTHNISVLRNIQNLIAVNSVIEVDLFGQANAEFLNGRQISGAGGLVDFLRGARLSPGGRPVVTLASTAANGAVSRIVPALPQSAPPSVARGDIGYVVTEHGCANLHADDIDARAHALIGIADPAHREGLRRAWVDIRAAL